MTVRRKPFGEWVVIYYDKDKTDSAKLLDRLKARGCRRAKQKAPVTGQLGDAAVSVLNPVAAPGDFFHIEVKLPEGASADVSIKTPEGWTVPDGAQRALKGGVSRCDVQLPRTAKKGNQMIAFQRGQQTLELKVDVVSWVKG
jgi:hypothetical protein